MEEIKNLNFPILSVEKTVNMLTNAYCAIVERKKSPAILPSVMLWGPPGVGKSQAIRQVAKDIEKKTGKKVHITDVRLLLFNPIDLRGIPTANADKTLAIWLKPQIFQMDDSSDVVNILFLDEISAAPQSVQAAAYQITLDRVVGEHRLPDNCFVIAAGNRVTDKSVSFKMPKALANRLLHIEVEGSFHSWQNWAIKTGVNSKVVGFLSSRPDRLFGFDASNDDLAFATPRSWEMVSNILNNVDDDIDRVFSMISGLVGSGVAIELRSWCNVYSELPNVEEIFAGKVNNVPRRSDLLYALVSSMTAYARENKNDIVAIGNSIRYASNLPTDFAALLISNYSLFGDGYEAFLHGLPEYIAFARKKGAYNNGSV